MQGRRARAAQRPSPAAADGAGRASGTAGSGTGVTAVTSSPSVPVAWVSKSWHVVGAVRDCGHAHSKLKPPGPQLTPAAPPAAVIGYNYYGVYVNGVAPMARVIPVKVLNQNGSG